MMAETTKGKTTTYYGIDVERMAEGIEDKIVRCKSEPGLMQIGHLVSN